MDAAKSFLTNNIKAVGAGVCAVGVTALLYKRIRTKNPRERVCGVDYPKDTVMLHQFLKGKFAPSVGHFIMKLETYLRITKIPYEPVYGNDMGPKKKLPWIEYNGTTMGDSQLIINFLNEQFNVNLNKPLSKEQRAMAWAIQKWIEEFTYHLNVYTKWCIFPDGSREFFRLPKYVHYAIQQTVKKMEYAVGVGRHSDQEIGDMMVFDMRQFSEILGDKKFLMGGDAPTEVDCAAFGILCQVRWHTPDGCPGKQVLIGELTNVMAYLDRIKQTYWPDWNERLHGAKKD